MGSKKGSVSRLKVSDPFGMNNEVKVPTPHYVEIPGLKRNQKSLQNKLNKQSNVKDKKLNRTTHK